MRVAELRDLLRRMPVPEDAFVLDGSAGNETYVLGQEGHRTDRDRYAGGPRVMPVPQPSLVNPVGAANCTNSTPPPWAR